LNKNFIARKTLLDTISGSVTAIAVSESWITTENEDYFQIDGYNFISNSRVGRTGGGVGIYLDNKFPFRVRDDLSQMNDIVEYHSFQ